MAEDNDRQDNRSQFTTVSLAEQTQARRQPNALPRVFPVMPIDAQPNRSTADPDRDLAGANSLEGAVAAHLALCALSLLRDGRRREAEFALAEAARVQAQALQRAVMATRTEFDLLPAKRTWTPDPKAEQALVEPVWSPGSIHGRSGRQPNTAEGSRMNEALGVVARAGLGKPDAP